jgi:hypothetical protein
MSHTLSFPCPRPLLPPPLPLVPLLVRRLQVPVRVTSNLLPTSRSSPTLAGRRHKSALLSTCHLVTHVELDTSPLGPCSRPHVSSDTLTVYSWISLSLILYLSFRHRSFALSCYVGHRALPFLSTLPAVAHQHFIYTQLFFLNTERFAYDTARSVTGETLSLVFPSTFSSLLTLCVAYVVSTDSDSPYKYPKPSLAERQATVALSLHLRLRAFETTAAHSFPLSLQLLAFACSSDLRPPELHTRLLVTNPCIPSSANRPLSDYIALAPVTRMCLPRPRLVGHVCGGTIFRQTSNSE